MPLVSMLLSVALACKASETMHCSSLKICKLLLLVSAVAIASTAGHERAQLYSLSTFLAQSCTNHTPGSTLVVISLIQVIAT